MLCGNCGKDIVEGGLFCPYCGERVENERTCTQCGTKLLPNAAFCHMCGAKNPALQACGTWDVESLNPFAEALHADSEPEKAALPELSELSPYAHQLEYYQYRRAYNHTVLNRNWIVYEDNIDHDRMLFIMDVDGKNQHTIMKRNDAGDYLLGVNDHGIWYLCFSGKCGPDESYEIPDRINVWGLNGEKIHEFRFNEEGDDVGNIYILGGEVFYIAKSPQGTERIMRISMKDDTPVCIFKGRRGEELSKLSVSATNIRLAFYLKSDEYNPKRPSGWVIVSSDLKKFTTLNGARDEYGDPMTEIFDVFLEQGKMWTAPTEAEIKVGFDRSARVERAIGRPESEPAQRVIWRDFRAAYFDGQDVYETNTYKLTRIDFDGKQFTVSYGLHGEADKFLVNDEYVLVNYDALCPVRLPRKFQTCELPGFENPEAILPWGQGDYRL